MKIKLLKPYQLSAADDVLDVDEPVAIELINRNIAEKVVIHKGKKEK